MEIDVMALTFGLEDARSLFDKLKRDARLLDEEVTSDKFFNFVVTGYSMIDWIKNDVSKSATVRNAVEAMYTNHWIKVCGNIATASKHFTQIVARRLRLKRNPSSTDLAF